MNGLTWNQLFVLCICTRIFGSDSGTVLVSRCQTLVVGHNRTAFCSGPTGTGTRVGDNWLISSFEVGDAHVSVQNGSEESVVGVSQGYGHPDTESKARVSFFDI